MGFIDDPALKRRSRFSGLLGVAGHRLRLTSWPQKEKPRRSGAQVRKKRRQGLLTIIGRA